MLYTLVLTEAWLTKNFFIFPLGWEASGMRMIPLLPLQDILK